MPLPWIHSNLGTVSRDIRGIIVSDGFILITFLHSITSFLFFKLAATRSLVISLRSPTCSRFLLATSTLLKFLLLMYKQRAWSWAWAKITLSSWVGPPKSYHCHCHPCHCHCHHCHSCHEAMAYKTWQVQNISRWAWAALKTHWSDHCAGGRAQIYSVSKSLIRKGKPRIARRNPVLRDVIYLSREKIIFCATQIQIIHFILEGKIVKGSYFNKKLQQSQKSFAPYRNRIPSILLLIPREKLLCLFQIGLKDTDSLFRTRHKSHRKFMRRNKDPVSKRRAYTHIDWLRANGQDIEKPSHFGHIQKLENISILGRAAPLEGKLPLSFQLDVDQDRHGDLLQNCMLFCDDHRNHPGPCSQICYPWNAPAWILGVRHIRFRSCGWPTRLWRQLSP